MLDHVFVSVSDLERSVRFYDAALTPLGITARLDYDGKDGPPGHPDLKGFGANGRMFLKTCSIAAGSDAFGGRSQKRH